MTAALRAIEHDALRIFDHGDLVEVATRAIQTDESRIEVGKFGHCITRAVWEQRSCASSNFQHSPTFSAPAFTWHCDHRRVGLLFSAIGQIDAASLGCADGKADAFAATHVAGDEF
jgi:hypothetical protein